MPANTAAIFALTPNCPQARIAAANTARDGSGTLVTLFTAGTNGSRIDWIRFTSAQATAAALSASFVCRVFVTDNAGTNPRLLAESILTTATASTVVIGAATTIDFMSGITTNGTTITSNGILGGLILQSGQLIKVSQAVYAGAQDQTDVTCRGGDF